MIKRVVCCSALLAAAVTAADNDFSEVQARVVSFTLENGLTVILYPRGDAPVIACVTYIKVGSVDEHKGITGIAHQLEHLAFNGTPHIGTKNYDAEKKALQELDQITAEIRIYQEKLPEKYRDAFAAAVANAAAAPVATDRHPVIEPLAALLDEWKKADLPLDPSEQTALLKLLRTFAEKAHEAEQYIEQNQYASVIDRNGGVGLNAFTGADRTVYHVSLPSNKLELWAALESDRYLNMVPRQLEKEKLVILEERRSRTDSNAFGRLYEALLSEAFQIHPYGHAVIGSRADILNYTRDKVMNFYRRHYTPRNTIVTVVGDIDVVAARKLITDYFSHIPTGQEPVKIVAVEPPQTVERRVEVEFPAQPLVLVAYHIPEHHHPDTPALTILNEIVSSGRASRLYAHLVKTKKAATAGSWIGPGARFPRLLYFSVEPIEGDTPDNIEAALLAEIEKLKTELPTAAEMQRVITRYRAQVLRDLRSNLGLAQQLADYQALSGDWRALFDEIQQISAVKSEQITAVARKYLTRQNCAFGRIISTNPPAPRIAPLAPPDNILGVSVK
ncbi:MAG: pitrilysin family protein [Planctomycetota bacterium]